MKTNLQTFTPRSWFSLFNWLVYTTVFMGRILRDSLLFTVVGGPQLLPLLLILNAIIMTWFGGQLEKWLGKYGCKKLSIWAFTFSGLFLFVMFAVLRSSATKGWIAVLYLLSEIPIFLAVNMIWIMAEDYFSEQQGQTEFPVISAYGLLGIVMGSGIVLLFNRGLDSMINIMLPLWGGLSLCLCGVAWFIHTRVPKLADGFEDDFIEEDNVLPVEADQSFGNGLGFILKDFYNSTKEECRWAHGNKYLWLFVLVTVCNFTLLAIFDQTLANGAASLKIDSRNLGQLLAWSTLLFGFFAALFQWKVFPKLLKKIGVARLNLGAPLFMFVGALVCVVGATNLFQNVWNEWFSSFGSLLIYFLLLARICAWAAEFLFNQTMLPFIYGAMPSDDVNRGRFLVEGPITAITNGCVGIFLMGYFALSKVEDTAFGYGYNLDILFMIALFAAIMMYIWSKQMVPEFSKVLLARLAKGDSLEELTSDYRVEFDTDLKVLATQVQMNGAESLNTSRIDFLVQTLGVEAIGKVFRVATNRDEDKKSRAEAIRGLVKLNAVSEFHETLAQYTNNNTLPSSLEIDALAAGAFHFGQLNTIQDTFHRWLGGATGEELTRLLHHLSQMGFDGALTVKEFLENELKEKTESTLSRQNIIQIAADLKSEHFYQVLSGYLRKDSDTNEVLALNLELLGDIQFNNHSNALDAFALILANIEDREDGSTNGAITLLNQHPWLVWVLFSLLELTYHRTPELLRPGRHVWPYLVQKMEHNHVDLSSKRLLQEHLSGIGEKCAPEFIAVTWDWLQSEKDDEGLTLRDSSSKLYFAAYFSYRLAQPERLAQDIGCFVACVEAYQYLQRSNYSELSDEGQNLDAAINHCKDKYRQYGGYASLFIRKLPPVNKWLTKRMRQWLQAYFLLLSCRYPDLNKAFTVYSIESMKDRLLSSDRVLHDDALTLLEQSQLPRDIYLDFRADMESLWDSLVEKNGASSFVDTKITIPVDRNEANDLWEDVILKQLNDPLLVGSN